jgi:hypothetical protein
MRVRIEINRPDLFLGLVVLGVSAGYLHAASQVPESLLADVVGAGGVPTALGRAMAALGVILCARGLLTRAPAEVAAAPSAEDDETSAGLRPHLLALGLLAILATYVVVMPYLGYIVSTALLVGAVARSCGAALGRNLLIIAIAGGLGLWLLFDPLLGIRMPVGSWWEWR